MGLDMRGKNGDIPALMPRPRAKEVVEGKDGRLFCTAS